MFNLILKIYLSYFDNLVNIHYFLFQVCVIGSNILYAYFIQPRAKADLGQLTSHKKVPCHFVFRIRIVQLEGCCKDHHVQPPDLFRANQKLKQIFEGVVQMPLEH